MKVLITGITGQDGSYLAEQCLERGDQVFGLIRRTSTNNQWRLKKARKISETLNHMLDFPCFSLLKGDITDYTSVNRIIREVQPDQIYNLAAMSHVGDSFNQPLYTWQATAIGCLNVLESVRELGLNCKIYQAGSSEQFGSSYNERYVDGVLQKFQNEETEMSPRSPYAVAKTAAFQYSKLYRDSYGLFVSVGILHNHSSERRGEEFLTQKVIKWIKEYRKFLHNSVQSSCYEEFRDESITIERWWDNNRYWQRQEFPKLRLGNLSSYRDESYAPDMTRGMMLMLDQNKPDDFVLASGKSYSMEEFVQKAFNKAGLGDWKNYVVIDPQLYRPAEVDYLCGDATKAREVLGWEPKHNLDDIIEKMLSSTESDQT